MLIEDTAHLTNSEYGLGEYREGKFDCFSLVYEYLKRKGVKLPEVFKGITLSTYKDLYLANKKQAQRLMVEFIKEFTTEIPIHKTIAGDILLLQLTSDNKFFAINCGNGNLLTAYTKFGVTINSTLKYYKIKKTFRFIFKE